MEFKLDAKVSDLKEVESRLSNDGRSSGWLQPLTVPSSEALGHLSLEKLQTMNWQPIEGSLPSLPGAIIDDWNTILTSCSTPLVLELTDGKQCQCRLQPDLKHDAQPDFRPEVLLKVEAGPYQMEIGVQHCEVFTMLHGPNAGLLPREIKCAIVEGYLDGLLNRMEQFGGPVCVTDVIFNPVETAPLNCLLEWHLVAEPEAVATKAYLGTDASGLEWLAGILTKISRNANDDWIDQITLPAALRFGSKVLTSSQIARLDVLDIILLSLSVTETFDWALSVYVSGSVFCSGKLKYADRSFTITEIVRQEMQNDNADQKLEDKAQDTSQDETELDVETRDETELDVETRLDELDVEMIFEIGRRYVRLGDLKKMTPGHILNLSSEISDPIQIYIGGSHFATGQMVQFENHLGVLLLTIKGQKDPHV